MTRKPTNTPRIQHERGMKAHTRDEHDRIVAKRGPSLYRRKLR